MNGLVVPSPSSIGTPFVTPMVNALLLDKKHQTRRLIPRTARDDLMGPSTAMLRRVRIKVNDELWVREAYKVGTINETNGRGTHVTVEYRDAARLTIEVPREELPVWQKWMGRWKPPRFMPRSVCRLTLRVTEVRIQRLQSISVEDAVEEGSCVRHGFNTNHLTGYHNGKSETNARQCFRAAWDTIHAKKDSRHTWNANPWVLAATFERTLLRTTVPGYRVEVNIKDD